MASKVQGIEPVHESISDNPPVSPFLQSHMSTTSPDEILLTAEESMEKAVEYLKKELRGMRTGRASTALVEFIKVECYGQSQDLKNIAAISIPEPAQILIKPFDAGTLNDIKKALDAAGLGLNPQTIGKALLLNLPSLTGDRRKQLVGKCKEMGEETKIKLRNARRDGNKLADGLKNDPKAHVPEDEVKRLHDEIQELLKKYEKETDEAVAKKAKEVETI